MRAVLSVLLPLFVAAAASAQDRAPTGQPQPPGPVAVVNGEPIAFAEWQAALSRLPAPPPGFPPERLKAVHREILSLMIDERLLKQMLAKAIPAPTAAEVNAKIAEVEKGLAAHKATVQSYLRETNQTMDQFRAGVAAELQWQSFVNQKLANVDLKAYYEQNKEMFDGVSIRVSHIVFAVPPGADPKAVAEATDRARNLRADLVKGLDFAEAAKKYSDDKNSGKAGGDLGYFPPRRGDSDPFLRAASALKVGEVSDVVRTDFGIHLIKQTERKAGAPTQYEPMKEAVKAVWADELRVAVILEQRKAAKVEIKLPE